MLGWFKDKIVKVPFAAFPIIFAMAVIPLVVRVYVFEAHLSTMSWYVSNDHTSDMFNYYKQELVVALLGIMIVIIVAGLIFSKKYDFNKAMIPLAVYVLFVILSTIYSDYRYFSLNGMDNHFETVYVLIGYCVMAVFCYWFADSETAVKWIVWGWIAGVALMCVIGVLQVTGHDLFRTDFGKWLIFPKELRKDNNIAFNFDENRVYLTLYNPNYVGFYASLTVPVLSSLFIFTKNKFLKVISFILTDLVILCLMGSGARNGMIALACGLLFMLFLFRKSLRKKWLSFVLSYASILAVFLGFNAVHGGAVTERLEAGFNVEKDTSDNLERIETTEENVTVTYAGEKLVLMMQPDAGNTLGLIMIDGDGKTVKTERTDTESLTYSIEDDRFPFEVSVGKINNVLGFSVKIEGKIWCFSNQTGYKGYYFYSPYGKFTKIEEAETAIFTNYSHLASGRGYLWARTIPLLKNYIFIGSGPDTFTVVFPQKDYVAASKMGYDKMTVTKPHNLYLQIGTQTGVISLVAFLAFNCIYLIECLKIYWKRKAENFLEYLGMAVMVAVIAYLISGIINDSTITVAPVYWCLIGLGLGINRMVKKQTTF